MFRDAPVRQASGKRRERTGMASRSPARLPSRVRSASILRTACSTVVWSAALARDHEEVALPGGITFKVATRSIPAKVQLSKTLTVTVPEPAGAAAASRVGRDRGPQALASRRASCVQVVREECAKMPADIGGGIYLSLKDRKDISSIHTRLLHFVEKQI